MNALLHNRHHCQGLILDSDAGLFYNHSMIEKMVRVGRLYDYYGALLTEHQKKCLELHYLQDFSLGEIAAELAVSRQAINDILRRTEESLEQYEAKLGLIAQEQKRMQALQNIKSLLLAAREKVQNDPVLLQKALDEIDSILKQEMRD